MYLRENWTYSKIKGWVLYPQPFILPKYWPCLKFFMTFGEIPLKVVERRWVDASRKLAMAWL
jgi:hypothetical protein